MRQRVRLPGRTARPVCRHSEHAWNGALPFAFRPDSIGQPCRDAPGASRLAALQAHGRWAHHDSRLRFVRTDERYDKVRCA